MKLFPLEETITDMQNEKELSDRYYRNKCHKAIVNIFYTSNWLVEQLKSVMEEEEITPQQYNILRILKLSDKPLSTLKIRERMIDKMSDTSRIVERLLKKGLVNKQVSAMDKRLVDVSLTEKGVHLLSLLDKKAEQIDNIISELSDNEIDSLNSILDKIRQKQA